MEREIPVEIVYKDKRHSSGRIREGRIVLYISSRLPKAEQARHVRLLTQRLISQSRRMELVAPPGETPTGADRTDADLARIAMRLDREHWRFGPVSIKFRKQEARWGSCNPTSRRIYISHRLKDAPLELLEYVVAHELCHLQEPNHGAAFWRLLSRAFPEWRRLRTRLRAYGFRKDLADRRVE
ncbi:MAG: M48 family metallopeptidase [Syntrophothermus sp.]